MVEESCCNGAVLIATTRRSDERERAHAGVPAQGRDDGMKDTPPHSRDTPRPSFANHSCPKNSEGARAPQERARCDPKRGAGKTGCALHPRSHVQQQTKNAHEHTGSAETLRPSLRNGLRLTSCSPRRDHSLLVTVIPRKREPPENLTPAIGASGPHDFAVRIGAVRPRQKARNAAASTASHAQRSRRS
jgi:hypothetical protein